MKIAIAADHGGFQLKENFKKYFCKEKSLNLGFPTINNITVR